MRLTDTAPALEVLLGVGPRYEEAQIRRETVFVPMRDGIRLATDLHLPPVSSAPTVCMRTPYGRARPNIPVHTEVLMALARRGFAVVSQDCRGTGDSEPDQWDFSIYELEDGVDFIEWLTEQEWYDGFIGSYGGSYVGWVQWCMAMHPAMSAIAPEVAGFGISVPATSPERYMMVNSYSRSVGKGMGVIKSPTDDSIGTMGSLEEEMLAETLAGGFFNDPIVPIRRDLYDEYSSSPPAARVELLKRALDVEAFEYTSVHKLPSLFGRDVTAYNYLHPQARDPELLERLHAPALLITGWYDWGVDSTLGTWALLMQHGKESVRSRSRLFISPDAHGSPGYKEGREGHPELDRVHRSAGILDLLVHWYESVRKDELDSWPAVIYYLMGANEWRSASEWPPSAAREASLYLGPDGTLIVDPPIEASEPDRYVYDPDDPTPTIGGDFISSVFVPGSCDVSDVQQRADVVTYTTGPLERDLDAVGPLKLVLFASSSALDTDFSARLSDVFPDGRAIELRSVTLRARYRDPEADLQLLEPGRIYRFEIDMWATANRFKAGHRICVDISSANFPKFNRNTNRGGEPGPPILAEQTIYHGPDHPSQLIFSVIDSA